MIEEWKTIEGYENYKVSNFGRVKSLGNDKLRKEKILKPGKDGWGYLFVCLCRNGKRKNFLIHRLVATAFLPKHEGLKQINHRDEDKTNNCVSNLEWCDCKYNNNFGTRTERAAASKSKPVEASKFSDFREICLKFPSTKEAGRNGYCNQCVSKCCRGCYHYEGNNKYKNLYWRYEK